MGIWILWVVIIFNNGKGDIIGIVIVIVVFFDVLKYKKSLINENSGKLYVLMWVYIIVNRDILIRDIDIC